MFAIQNSKKGIYAIGSNGGGLGFASIPNSVALAFNLYQSGVSNAQTLGVYTGGANPVGSSTNLAGSAVNLHSGHPFHVQLTYNGTTLTVTLTDKTTAASVTVSFAVNIVSSVGSSSAYVGFTGSTGAYVSTQNILNWSFSN